MDELYFCAIVFLAHVRKELSKLVEKVAVYFNTYLSRLNKFSTNIKKTNYCYNVFHTTNLNRERFHI